MKPNLKEVIAYPETLRGIVAEANRLVEKLVETRGELTPELEQSLTLNAQSLMGKVDSYVFVDEQLEAQETIWKRKADAFNAIAKGFKSARERLKNSIKFAMGELKTDEMKGQDYRYKLSRGKSSLIINPDVLPAEFKMVVTETVPDKEKIRAALEDGFQIPGCYLEETLTLRTYENKGD